MALQQRTGDVMQSAVITGGLLSGLLAPWSSGFVAWLATSHIGQWVMFPEGYEMTLLSAITTGITYLIGYLKLRQMPATREDGGS
jgi:hypothetical protein